MTINTTHPIGQYLRWALLPSDSLKEQALNVSPGGSVGSTTSLPQGVAYVPDSGYTTWATPQATIDPYNNSITIAWYGKVDTTGSSVLAQYVGPYGWYLQSEPWDINVISLRFGTWWGGGGSLNQLGITNGTVHHIALRFRKSAGKIDIFLDGVAVATDVAWVPDPGAVGGGGTFYMRNASASCACITAQVYEGALSDVDLASLGTNPLQVFVSPAINLAVSNLTQSNAVSTLVIGVSGNLYVESLVQVTSVSTLQVTRTQTLAVDSLAQVNVVSAVSLNPYGRLKRVLAEVPLNTWVQVNTTRYLDCQMLPADRPYGAGGAVDHLRVIVPWSSFAFDHTYGRMLLWGGGHANYSGNQLYAWNADSGAWEQMSLPSAVDGNPATQYIVDKNGPQSSHTYQNNVWLRVNNMFCTFGGAALPSGGPPLENNGGTPRRVAPWVYDLTKKDSTKVGGSDGSGMDPSRLGLNAWRHRRDNVPTSAVGGTDTYAIDYLGHGSGKSAAAVIGGKDVVFILVDAGSGFPFYYRYEFGDVRAGENDTCKYYGRSGNIVVFEGWMVYDPSRGFLYGNAFAKNDSYTKAELIAKNVSGPGINPDPIRLVYSSDGTPFDMNPNPSLPAECPYGAAYDDINDCIWLWGGTAPDTGVVYRINIPAYNSGTGWAATTWTVDKITPAGSRPYGLPSTPVLGKLKYVPEVGALIALDSIAGDGSRDAGVWMFKTTAYPIDLTVDNAVQKNVLSTVSISVPTIDLSISNLMQANLVTSPVIVQSHLLKVANVTQANIAGNVNFNAADIHLSARLETGHALAGVRLRGFVRPITYV